MKTKNSQPKFTKENYFSEAKISGVLISKLNYFPSEDGYFIELARLKKDNSIEATPSFKVQQISYSSLDRKAIKAWHIHDKQDDLWFIPPDNKVLIGLHDLRKNSTTKGNTQRFVLGNHQSNLLFIPKGVAHGCANLSNSPSILIYMTSKKFNRKNPDEKRLPWNYLGKDFWEVKKG